MMLKQAAISINPRVQILWELPQEGQVSYNTSEVALDPDLTMSNYFFPCLDFLARSLQAGFSLDSQPHFMQGMISLSIVQLLYEVTTSDDVQSQEGGITPEFSPAFKSKVIHLLSNQQTENYGPALSQQEYFLLVDLISVLDIKPSLKFSCELAQNGCEVISALQQDRLFEIEDLNLQKYPSFSKGTLLAAWIKVSERAWQSPQVEPQVLNLLKEVDSDSDSIAVALAVLYSDPNTAVVLTRLESNINYVLDSALHSLSKLHWLDIIYNAAQPLMKLDVLATHVTGIVGNQRVTHEFRLEQLNLLLKSVQSSATIDDLVCIYHTVCEAPRVEQDKLVILDAIFSNFENLLSCRETLNQMVDECLIGNKFDEYVSTSFKPEVIRRILSHGGVITPEILQKEQRPLLTRQLQVESKAKIMQTLYGTLKANFTQAFIQGELDRLFGTRWPEDLKSVALRGLFLAVTDSLLAHPVPPVLTPVQQLILDRPESAILNRDSVMLGEDIRSLMGFLP